MKKIVKGVFGAVFGLSAGLAGAVTVEKGVEITLEADAPEENKAFHHWEGTGAPTGEAAFQPTWTYVPTASGEVTPVYGTLVTVADGGDLAAAVTAAGEYGVIHAGAGTYTISAQLVLGSVRLEGAGRDGEGASVLTQSGSGFRALYLNNKYAYVSGFLIRDFQAGVNKGFGAYIDKSGGTVVDCRMTGGYSSDSHRTGGGVQCLSSDGLVARCVIDNNKLGYGSIKSNDGGGGVYMTAGALENCLIYGNYSSHEGGGIMMTGGTVRNCTVVDNFCQGAAGLWYKGSTKIYNTAIFGNIAWFGPSDGGCEWRSDTVANSNNFVSCASSLPVGATGLVCEPCFNAPGIGDYAPRAGSQLIDAGGDAGTPMSLPLDLYGNPRLSGEGVDIGCIEYDGDSEAVGIRISPRPAAFKGDTVTFVPVFRGGLAADTCTWTVKDAASGQTVSTLDALSPSYTCSTAGSFTLELSAGGRTATWTNALCVVERTNVVSTLTSAAVQAAVDEAIDGSVIILEDGIYEITAPVTVYKGVKLISRNGAEKCIFKVPANKTERPLIMSAPGAELVGVTLTGGHDSKYQIVGSIVGAGGGLLDHCIISNNWETNTHKWGLGLGLGGKNAIVRNSLFENNRFAGGNQCHGGAVYMLGGVIENCLFKNNFAYELGGAVYMSGSEGNVINCTFVKNSAGGPKVSTGKGGAIYLASASGTGRIVNCAFYDNSCDQDKTEGSPDWYCASSSAKAMFVNCAMSACAPNATCFVPENGNFNFSDADNGDYRLKTLSPLVDAGADEYVNPLIVKDFGGTNARILGDHVDIGCYEADLESFVCSFDVSPREALENTNIVFSAATAGAPDDAVYQWTVTQGDAPVAVAAADRPCVTNLFAVPGWYTVRLDVSFGGTDYPAALTNVLHIGAHTNYVVSSWNERYEPQLPYGSWSTAATNIQDAVSEAVDGAVVMLGDGTFGVGQTVVVEKEIVLTSAHGAERTEITASKGNCRVVKINNDKAVVERVSITKGQVYDNSVGGCGVLLAPLGGTLRDCIVERNGPQGQHTPGGGVTVQAGLVDRCVIRYNNGAGSGNNGGGGVCMQGGTLRNSLVFGNRANDGAGVYVKKGSPTIENCTIVSNVCDTAKSWEFAKRGGLSIENAVTIRNTLIYGNTNRNYALADPRQAEISIYASGNDPSSVSNAVKLINCALPFELTLKNMTDCVLTTDGMFRRFDSELGKFDFRLSPDSPLRDRGVLLDWMDGATDLMGKPRIQNRIPDIGAYETALNGMLLLVK